MDSNSQMDDHFICKTYGDLEALLLYENKGAFASIINKHLYVVSNGEEAMFCNSALFGLFIVRVFELLAERKIQIANHETQILSLFTGAKKFAENCPNQTESRSLIESINAFESWLAVVNKFEIWNGSRHLYFDITRRQMIRIASMLSKHSIFNIKSIINELAKSEKSEFATSSVEIVEILSVLEVELEGRLVYLSTWLIELLHDYFSALIELVNVKFNNASGENEKGDAPLGMSDAFWALHWSTRSFAGGYNREHYGKLRPTTSKHLKMRY